MSEVRSIRPADRRDVAEALWAIKRQLDLLGWHVKQLRDGASVATEIDAGMEAVETAVRKLVGRLA